jgi:hypothetical protein
VEKLHLSTGKNQKAELSPERSPEFLKVCVHWDYPLSVPPVNFLWAGIKGRNFPHKKSTVPLQAAWTTVRFQVMPEKINGKE